MGRLRVGLHEVSAICIAHSVPPSLAPAVPVTYSIADAWVWAEVEKGGGPSAEM